MEINGYPNYLIYEDGRIWSKNIKKFMTAKLKRNGYFQLGIRNNNKRKFFTIHRLVALHYIDNPNNYETVDHIDRNITNNHVSNLRWASRSMQQFNRKSFSNTGEKHISKQFNRKLEYYSIAKANCFRTTLRCDEYTLQDAINLRDALLGE